MKLMYDTKLKISKLHLGLSLSSSGSRIMSVYVCRKILYMMIFNGNKIGI